METLLNNTASVLGNYNSIPTEISTQVLVVTILTGLTVTKSADKLVWSDGDLTYKIEVDNQTEKPYTSPVITDTLDPSLITLKPNSIKIDNTLIESTEYSYDNNTGLLTINLPDIASKTKKVITFEVVKK